MRRQIIFSIVIALLLCSSIGAMGQIAGIRETSTQEKKSNETEWADPLIVEVGKEAPRSIFMSYDNGLVAREFDHTKSVNYIPLNGKWKFKYYDNHNSSNSEKYNNTDWDTITVPGNWQRQGYGVPIYTNSTYEFSPSNPTPPHLPNEIPLGLYQREFFIPLGTLDRDVFLTFDGIKGGATIYINDKKVGYSEDSKSRAEFLINDYIKFGDNTLRVEVMQWSTGSYLECGNFWRLSGIERDVFIWSQPKARIDDFRVVATLDSTYTNGVFDLQIALKNSFVLPTGYMQVWYELEDSSGNLVDYSYKEMEMGGNSVDTVRFDRELPNVKKWSAETPNLYTLVLKIKKDGRFDQYVSTKIGFRTSEIRGNDFLINGKRVLIKGVNYHEHDEITGHYLSEETIVRDMELMKQANVNAIRTSHYPQGRRFYELADRYGFYVVSEANIESHGMGYDSRKGGTLANNPEWLNAHMERTENMYEQLKNYPCVVIWSLGNEAGNGYNFYKTYQYLKGIDTLRPVQYERAELEWNTDIFCPMYPSAQWFKDMAGTQTDRPVIVSEYSHGMGNSNGALCEMWEAIYSSNNLQGGFISDWVDQGLLEFNEDSTDITWYYGGDYGEGMPSDGNFLANGLVSADRTPHPALLSEVRKAYQYIDFDSVDLDKGLFRVTNRYDFDSLSKFNITYEVKEGSKKLGSGTLKLSLAPGESSEISVGSLENSSGHYRYIDFSARLKQKDGLLDKGYEVASEQYTIAPGGEKQKYSSPSRAKITIDQGEESIDLSSNYFLISFDKFSGFMTSYNVGGEQMIADSLGLRPTFWRAPTDNDYGADLPKEMEMWRNLGDRLVASVVTVSEDNGTTPTVTVRYDLAQEMTLTIVYTIYNSGVVKVSYDFEGDGSSGEPLYIPRLGMRMRIPAKYSTLEYLGRGPQENYIDRRSGTKVGLYRSSTLLEAFDYIRPQETGHHTDSEFLSLTHSGRSGIAVVAQGSTMEFNALSNSIEDFDAEGAGSKHHPYQWHNFSSDEPQNPDEAYGTTPRHTHSWDIKPRPFVELIVDAAHSGVGGENSWGALPEDKYRVAGSKNYTLSFTIVPIKSTSGAYSAAKYSY